MNTEALRLILFTTSSNIKQSRHFNVKSSLLHHCRCPPCKTFSPQLIEFYNSCSKNNDIEVIFVSSDRDEKSFGDYFGKMPWLAMLPSYTSDENRGRQGKLADMFKIQGIPSVIVLDAKTGNFVTDNGRMEVTQATSEASKKELIQTWLAKEAVPIDQAVFSDGGSSSNIFVKVFMFFAKNPAYIFGTIYFVKQFLRYLERLGNEDEIEDQKEL